MIRIREILLPENVLLDIPAGSREEGIQKVAESLKADTRIVDWEEFYQDLLGTVNHGARNASELGHMNTVAAICTSWYDFP